MAELELTLDSEISRDIDLVTKGLKKYLHTLRELGYDLMEYLTGVDGSHDYFVVRQPEVSGDDLKELNGIMGHHTEVAE